MASFGWLKQSPRAWTAAATAFTSGDYGQQDGAVAAHEVDVFIAIHVPIAATVGMVSEVGIGARHGGGREACPPSAGNHCTGAFK